MDATNPTVTPADNGGSKVTPTDNGGINNGTPPVNTQADNTTQKNDGGEPKPSEPFKVFSTKEEFDKHSAGMVHNAQTKAEKELLALLGLKPDEKDKLAKFKEAYDNTLSEAEKQAKNLENLNSEVITLKAQLAEKDAVITALGKMTGKNPSDVDKYVRMAKGLVDENTTIDKALEQVLSFMKVENPKPPVGKPLGDPAPAPSNDENPFKTGNLTKQGEMIKTDREKARAMYMAVYGKGPAW